MKTILKSLFIALLISFIAITNAFSQNKVVVVKENHTKNKVVVVKNKNHHFKKTKVFHPHWAPKVRFHRRWVYFPHYNFYWDNFRNVYLIRTDTIWFISETAPKEVEKVDLSKEKSIELSEEYDTQETIQDKNEEHQKEYEVK